VSAARVVDEPRNDPKGNIRASFETDFADLYGPVMTVRHNYIVEQRCLRSWVTFTQRWDGTSFQAFLKEPKLTIGFVEPFESVDVCLQGPGGTLSRNWEIAKRGDAPISLMLHAWEGGTGLPDCLACARAFGPASESCTAYLSVSLGEGWRM
jgi:hypothetical protein